MVTACFRFYAELNDFLAPAQRQYSVAHVCARDATVKHMIEALGVPHTEVGFILVDGQAVDFSHRLREGERIVVYPSFASIDIEAAVALRPVPDQPVRFIADAHLGRLAKHLRMLGFDVLYRNDYSDAAVARIAADEGRVVLTRDRDLLMRREIVHGCYMHAESCEEEIDEVLSRFGLTHAVQAFSRCLMCNGLLHTVEKSKVEHRVPPHSRLYYERFYECEGCTRIYWEGSHVARMRERMARILNLA